MTASPRWAPAAKVKVPAGAQVVDGTGMTLIPGIVGLHDHMYYSAAGGVSTQMSFTGPRLYLASGVTSVRTTGSVSPYADINLKKSIDAGETPGPRIHVTIAVPHRRCRRWRDVRHRRAGRGEGLRDLLGPRGRHLGQVLRRHLQGLDEGGDRRGASPRHQDHRSPLLGDLPGGGGARHRRPVARRVHGHRLRARPRSRTSARPTPTSCWIRWPREKDRWRRASST